MTWLIHKYFIFNYILCLIYPISKLFSNTITSERETHIITSFFIIILLRYLRYYTSLQMFIYDSVFYIKIASLLLFLFINLKYAIWYASLIIIFHIISDLPKYTGKSKIIHIQSHEEYKRFILNPPSKKTFYSFAVFHSPISTKSIFTEEIWAWFSLKYSSLRFSFYYIDVDVHSSIAKENKILGSSFSVELPVAVLFKNGEEVKRYPPKDKNGNSLQVKYYSKTELMRYFEFERICEEELRGN